MNRGIIGCYFSLFTTISTTTTLTTTRVLPLVAGFHSRVLPVSALRSSTGRSSSSMDALSADLAEGAENLFAETPLIRSQPLSALVGKPVYLKLDALQASGSFKVGLL